MQISKLAHTITLFPKTKRTPEKFWELVDVHMNFLYNMALRYAGNRYDAEDLVQDTFYAGLQKFYQLREERKFKSWLFAILRNTYLKNRRHEGKFLKSEYEDGTDYIRLLENAAEHIDVETAYEQKIESEQIQELLNELPEKQKNTAAALLCIRNVLSRNIRDTGSAYGNGHVSAFERKTNSQKEGVKALQAQQRERQDCSVSQTGK